VKPAFHKLFSEFKLGQHVLRNRMFVSAHMTMMVDGGVPGEQQAAYYRARAAGGVGLIVMESAAVHRSAIRGGSVIDATSDAVSSRARNHAAQGWLACDCLCPFGSFQRAPQGHTARVNKS